jgi:hypothetical protein
MNDIEALSIQLVATGHLEVAAGPMGIHGPG